MEKLLSKAEMRLSGDGMEANKELGDFQTSSVEIPIPVKRREPKFVPYEPYKAAVKPILPSWDKGAKGPHPVTKQSPDLLETHIPYPLENMASKSGEAPVVRVLRRMHSDKANTPGVNHSLLLEQWEDEKHKMEDQIKRLKDEKREVENQFKIQTKVNAELKKLLVASLGEDMQTKVQFLSEDKARLAQDIACYSQLIQEDHEELEKLAIQCDIWRSKFLASSMMVDELAQWKAMLSRKYEESKEAIQWMLQEHHEMRQYQMATFRYLSQLQSSFDPSVSSHVKTTRKPCNLLNLAQKNRQLVESVHFRLLGSAGVKSEGTTPWLEESTPAEEFAQKVLQSKDVMAESLVRKESSWHFGKTNCLFHPHFRSNQVTVNCCKHCSGDIDVV